MLAVATRGFRSTNRKTNTGAPASRVPEMQLTTTKRAVILLEAVVKRIILSYRCGRYTPSLTIRSDSAAGFPTLNDELISLFPNSLSVRAVFDGSPYGHHRTCRDVPDARKPLKPRTSKDLPGLGLYSHGGGQRFECAMNKKQGRFLDIGELASRRGL